MQLREIMRTDVIDVEPAETLQAAAQAMKEGKISSVLVTEDGYLIGILTERDMVKAVAEGIDTENVHVRDYMTPTPVAVNPDTSVEEAVQIMLEHSFRHLPVVDGERELKGVVSIRDLAKAGIKLPAEAVHK
ncbi:MAG: CBS domain-containing protein [Actinomycetota bacterium]